MLDKKLIEVNVQGFNITTLDEEKEMHDIFVPMNAYRLNTSQARLFVPSTHEVVDIKRTYEQLFVKYEELKKIAQ